MNPNDHIESLAQVAITRITIRGGNAGGAEECQKCKTGSVSLKQSFQCRACPVGTEAHKNNSECVYCSKGYYSDKEGGNCKKCPAFTVPKRYIDEQDEKLDPEKGGTHCELEPELHVKRAGRVFHAKHFKARSLCSEDNYLANSHLCAGRNIIGPISDIAHISEQLEDMTQEDTDGLEEDEDWEDDQWDQSWEERLGQEEGHIRRLQQVLMEENSNDRQLADESIHYEENSSIKLS